MLATSSVSADTAFIAPILQTGHTTGMQKLETFRYSKYKFEGILIRERFFIQFEFSTFYYT